MDIRLQVTTDGTPAGTVVQDMVGGDFLRGLEAIELKGDLVTLTLSGCRIIDRRPALDLPQPNVEGLAVGALDPAERQQLREAVEATFCGAAAAPEPGTTATDESAAAPSEAASESAD